MKIIFKFQFFITLKQLKTYLNFTNWKKNYVFYYVQLTNSLQIRKTFIFKIFFIKNNTRKRFNNDICLNIFIESKIKSYEIIQKKNLNSFFSYITIEFVNYISTWIFHMNAILTLSFFTSKTIKIFLSKTTSSLYCFSTKYSRRSRLNIDLRNWKLSI